MSQEKDTKQLIEQAKSSIIDFDEKGAEDAAIKALEMGLDVNDFIEKGFLEGMKAVGDMFEEGNACLLHIFAASDAMKAGIAVFDESDYCKRTNESLAIELVGENQRDEKIEILETMFRINGYDVVEIPDKVAAVDFIEHDSKFVDVPSKCKEEIKAAIAANPEITTFQLSVI
ncbi:MAG: B12-binding domain-containing protein [Methanolobus sp.]